MKSRLMILLSLVVFLLLTTLICADSGIKISINGEHVKFTKETGYPFMDENNRMQVPFRVVLEKLGAKVHWDTYQSLAMAEMNGVRIGVPIGKNMYYKNNLETPNDTSAIIKDGKTYLPIRAIVEEMGYKIDWDGKTKTVIINELPPKETPVISENPEGGKYEQKGIEWEFDNVKMWKTGKKTYENRGSFAGVDYIGFSVDMRLTNNSSNEFRYYMGHNYENSNWIMLFAKNDETHEYKGDYGGQVIMAFDREVDITLQPGESKTVSITGTTYRGVGDKGKIAHMHGDKVKGFKLYFHDWGGSPYIIYNKEQHNLHFDKLQEAFMKAYPYPEDITE